MTNCTDGGCADCKAIAEKVAAPVADGRRWSDGARWTSHQEVHAFEVKSRDADGNVIDVFCTHCGGVLPL